MTRYRLHGRAASALLLCGYMACLIVGLYYENAGAAMQPLCDDVRVIFARGSDAKLDGDVYKKFSSLESILKNNSSLESRFYELGESTYGGYRYPAKGGAPVLIGAKIGGSSAKVYRESVKSGKLELKAYIAQNINNCPDTKYVLAGYSQGAQVIGEYLAEEMPAAIASKVVYSAFYGDPKLYLPEGEGKNPPACRGLWRSPWNMYAPCETHKGSLDARSPYLPHDLESKAGLWCNKNDYICGSTKDPLGGSFFSGNGHEKYKDDGGFIEQSFIRIAAALYGEFPAKFNVGFHPKNIRMTSYDTVILISKPGYTAASLSKRRGDVLNLANSTINKKGRVALISVDQSDVTVHCGFGCSASEISSELNGMTVGNNKTIKGDVLKGLNKALDGLTWRQGAQKSAAIFTENGYLGSEAGKAALKVVVDKALKIDPVNMYVVTDAETQAEYQDLADMTGGSLFVVDENGDLSGDLSTVLDRPYVALGNSEYWAQPGQEVYFDASDSYTMDDSAIVSYQWDLDGDGAFEASTTEPKISKLYSQKTELMMQVKATDSQGRSGTMSAPVYIQTESPFDDSSDAAPPEKFRVATVDGEQDQVQLTWKAPAEDAKYYMIYLNDFPLGYVASSQSSLVIEDIDPLDELEFTAYGISEDGRLGKELATASWNDTDDSDQSDNGSDSNDDAEVGDKKPGGGDQSKVTDAVKSGFNPVIAPAVFANSSWLDDVASIASGEKSAATVGEPDTAESKSKDKAVSSGKSERSSNDDGVWRYVVAIAVAAVVIGLVAMSLRERARRRG